MDHPTFDRMARRLAAGASRRSVVRGAFTAAAGSALVALGQSSAAGAADVTAENCTPEGKRCGSGKRQRPCKTCCTKNVIRDQNGRKRCSCVRLGNGCSNDSQCCEGICLDGICQVSPVCVPLQAACVAGDTCCAGVCGSVAAIRANAFDSCCIALGATGCTVDADCCGGSASFAFCDSGTCQPT